MKTVKEFQAYDYSQTSDQLRLDHRVAFELVAEYAMKLMTAYRVDAAAAKLYDAAVKHEKAIRKELHERMSRSEFQFSDHLKDQIRQRTYDLLSEMSEREACRMKRKDTLEASLDLMDRAALDEWIGLQDRVYRDRLIEAALPFTAEA